ncbi:MAG: hypothetical protein HQL19_00335 [Candidatus Omnitrophica bacterium]|nr:hypothetical protein [Candidatus Omnitrophota bacterium]
MPDFRDAHHQELFQCALILSIAVKKMLQVKGGIYLSADPEPKEKNIVQFEKRMRVDGLEKFGDRTAFSTVFFCRDKEHLERHAAVGSFTIFIPVNYISKLLWQMEYPRIDEEDDMMVLDACGTVANLVAGYFVKEMMDMGYVHLEMSHFESYINTAVDGVEFPSDQATKYETEFYIKGEKRIVTELAMGYVPRY